MTSQHFATYTFKGRDYTAARLMVALLRDSGAAECSLVHGNQIKTYKDRTTVAQVYNVTPPVFGQQQVVTRA